MAPDAPVAAVTGIGMRAANGEHAVQVAASVRAAVNRFREWPHLVLTEGPLVASFVDPDLLDRSWVDKVFQLLAPTVVEAIVDSGLVDSGILGALGRAGRLRMFVNAPRRDRAGTEAAAIAALPDQLSRGLLPDGVAAPVDVFFQGRVGGVAALLKAVEAIATDQADVCLVAGVDSLLHGPSLRALMADDRVKTPNLPSGLIPGEGAGCLVLESRAAARRRRTAVKAGVGFAALAQEAAGWKPDSPVRADGLVRAMCSASECGVRSSRVLLDLNGERWRFLEWTVAEARLADLLPAGWRPWHPADCWGDVGAAFAPMAVALGARAFARRFAGGGSILVAASGDRGERGAFVLLPPEAFG